MGLSGPRGKTPGPCACVLPLRWAALRPGAGAHAGDAGAGAAAVSPAARARLAATFWHFFGALWVYVYALLVFL